MFFMAWTQRKGFQEPTTPVSLYWVLESLMLTNLCPSQMCIVYCQSLGFISNQFHFFLSYKLDVCEKEQEGEPEDSLGSRCREGGSKELKGIRKKDILRINLCTKPPTLGWSITSHVLGRCECFGQGVLLFTFSCPLLFLHHEFLVIVLLVIF